VESEVFHLTLLLNFLSFVKIDDLPSLVGSTVFAPDPNGLSFNILSSGDIKCLTIVPVDEVFSFILEDLPPVGVSAPDLHVVALS
jgi:hypothetical protein